MKKARRWGIALGVIFSLVSVQTVLAQADANALKCVGLYSETSDGYVSYREIGGSWAVIKVGDVVPSNGEVRVNVDRDWVEFTPANNPNAVYEITGSESGDVVRTVPEILKGTPKAVSFPEPSGSTPDPKFKDKLVVTQYVGRQIYNAGAGTWDKDIKYGDVLDRKGKVTIIAINTTVTLMNASGGVTTVIGPLKFDVEKVLTNQKLYKFLNVPR